MWVVRLTRSRNIQITDDFFLGKANKDMPLKEETLVNC